jgi:hypothetical protein
VANQAGSLPGRSSNRALTARSGPSRERKSEQLDLSPFVLAAIFPCLSPTGRSTAMRRRIHWLASFASTLAT